MSADTDPSKTCSPVIYSVRHVHGRADLPLQPCGPNARLLVLKNSPVFIYECRGGNVNGIWSTGTTALDRAHGMFISPFMRIFAIAFPVRYKWCGFGPPSSLFSLQRSLVETTYTDIPAACICDGNLD
ncbi:hypothetical protein Bbelb_105750 [Branchiostoma belcheri]|nr:hypothetical protein Bbelb_105750 [Branchiostoma belcheri]